MVSFFLLYIVIGIIMASKQSLGDILCLLHFLLLLLLLFLLLLLYILCLLCFLLLFFFLCNLFIFPRTDLYIHDSINTMFQCTKVTILLFLLLLLLLLLLFFFFFFFSSVKSLSDTLIKHYETL
jgi:hypothetical protein